MSNEAHLVKEMNAEVIGDEMIIKKIVNLTPSFSLKYDKILNLFQGNLNEALTGELTMDKYTWSNILNDLDYSKYSQYELEMIENISNDLKDKEFVCYDCF